MRSSLALASLFALAALPLATAQALPLRKGEPLAEPAPVNRLIVKLREEHGGRARGLPERVADLATSAGVRLQFQREMAGGLALARLPAALPAAAAHALARRLEQSPLVEYVAPDQLRRPTDGLVITLPGAVTAPNDPQWASQWNLMTPTATTPDGPALGGANLPEAWAITTGSSSTVVAVLDTGILPHPELEGRLLPGYDFISFAFTANDGNLRDSDARDPGNWVSASEANTGDCTGQAEQDSDWHGTQVAGIVGARGNNASDIAGVAWNTRILPVRVLGKCGGYDSDILDAVRWAAGLPVKGVPAKPTPADVLNLSFGGPGACSAAYVAAFRDVRAVGASVVVATGNDASSQVLTPANCPNVLAITGHALDGSPYFYANVGPEVALSAPAGGYGTAPDDAPQGNSVPLTVLHNSGSTTPSATWTLDYWEGTSLAAPHVAGTIALIRALLPGASPDQVRSLLTGTARPFAAGSWCALAGTCGAGMLDAGQAVKAAAQLSATNQAPVATALPLQSGRVGEILRLTLSASDANGDTLTWTAVTLPAGATLDSSGRFNWVPASAGLYSLAYEVSDGLATTAPVLVQLSINPSRAVLAPPAPASGGGALSLWWLAALAALGLRRRR